jgi:RNA polymerase sigma-70 factor (ECF subfamily)
VKALSKENKIMTDEQFTALAQTYMDTVFRLAYSYMKSKADADDITQNVLLKLYTRDKPFESPEHIRNWLIRVTLNECKSAFRTLWRKTEDIADYANTLTMPTQEHRELFELVMSLPMKYRVVLYLFYYEGYTTAQIAQALHIQDATVRTHLTRGRQKLKTILQEAENI